MLRGPASRAPNTRAHVVQGGSAVGAGLMVTQCSLRGLTHPLGGHHSTQHAQYSTREVELTEKTDRSTEFTWCPRAHWVPQCTRPRLCSAFAGSHGSASYGRVLCFSTRSPWGLAVLLVSRCNHVQAGVSTAAHLFFFSPTTF